MCDCEELEMEDFEVMLATLSKPSQEPEKTPAEAQIPLQVASRRKR